MPKSSGFITVSHYMVVPIFLLITESTSGCSFIRLFHLARFVSNLLIARRHIKKFFHCYPELLYHLPPFPLGLWWLLPQCLVSSFDCEDSIFLLTHPSLSSSLQSTLTTTDASFIVIVIGNKGACTPQFIHYLVSSNLPPSYPCHLESAASLLAF